MQNGDELWLEEARLNSISITLFRVVSFVATAAEYIIQSETLHLALLEIVDSGRVTYPSLRTAHRHGY